MINRCIVGNCLDVLPTLEAGSVQTCVTSPPYWGLRDYGHDGQLGLESTPEEYVERMVSVFREVKRVLRDDGTLWCNLGDSYAANRGSGDRVSPDAKQATNKGSLLGALTVPRGLKAKDLVGIPWRVAFALQSDGWYLRQDIIWAKPNPMPESVRDSCTKSHEYIFLLSKSERYYFDADAIAEPLAYGSVERLSQPNIDQQHGSDRVPGKTNGAMKAVYKKPYTNESTKDYAAGGAQDASATKARIVDKILAGELVTRNKRSVWTVTTKPFRGAHFATFPPDLIEPCILAGSKPGDVVLDPFGGSGTTGMVAEKLGRQWLMIELNPAYAELSRDRTAQAGMVFA